MLGGRVLYTPGLDVENTWPPLYSLVFVPFALLARIDVHIARGAWLLVSTAAAAAGVILAVRIVHADRERPVALRSLAVVVPLLLALRFYLDNLDHLQVNLVLLAMTLAGFAALSRGRELRGGAWLGAAAALKVYPVLVLPYLVWRRRCRALAAMLASGALLSALPVLVRGRSRFVGDVAAWLELAGSAQPVRRNTQSLGAVLDRVLVHADTVFSHPDAAVVASGSPVVALATAAALAAILGLLVRAGRHGSRDPGAREVSIEVAAVLVLVVLFAPLAWHHYFVFVVPALLWTWRGAFDATLRLPRRTRLGARAALALYALLVVASNPSFVGDAAAAAMLVRGCIALGALTLLAALLALRAAISREPATL